MMIANYFKLQTKILKRHLVDAGFPAFVLYPIIILLFIFLYYFVKLYPTWGAYALILANFQYLFSLSDFKRSDFLKAVFPSNLYYRLRLLENILISLGSVTALILNSNYFLAIALLSSCILFVFTSTISIWKRSIPTPFTKYPFEFIIGLRKSWLLLLLLYIVGIIAFCARNPNLVLFCMLCVCVCCAFYYQNPESNFIHWNQTRKPTSFLCYKIKRGVVQLSILLCPLLILFAIVYPTEVYKALIVWLVGLTVIPFIISMKYAVFPKAISITEATIMGLCLMFYPLIIAVIPYYYFKAIQNLKELT